MQSGHETYGQSVHQVATSRGTAEVVGAQESSAESLGRDTLYSVIGAVARGPELGMVLPAIIDLLTEATACHACFVYLVEGDRLRMRAASSVYRDAVDRVSFGIDEGLCGWVVRHNEPAFIRENALADERMKVVPELEEERFQSMVAVPLRGREQRVIGVIVLHTEAPREFGQEVLDFLIHVASLVAGAIENARLYERERERARLLEGLASLVQRIAGVTEPEQLWQLAVEGTRELLAADRARLELVTDARGTVRVVARSGPLAGDPASAVDAPAVDAPDRGAIATRLTAADAHLGVLAIERAEPFSRDERDLAETLAGHIAVALRTLELISRLAEETIVRDLFDAIAAGRGDGVAGRARAARIDPDRPYLIVVLEPAGGSATWDAGHEVEERLRSLLPGTLCDLGTERLRALLPVGRGASTASAALPAVDAALGQLADEFALAVGRSAVQPRLAADPAALAEATGAARIARALDPLGGMRAWEELGVYRYLASAADGPAPDARHAAAISALWDYDERRSAELVPTLERYLGDRRVVPTARALFIHPNTLRQRLERVESITGLVLADEDPLSLELAIKVHRLARAGGGAPHDRA